MYQMPWEKLAFVHKIEIKSSNGELRGVHVEDTSEYEHASGFGNNYRNSETTIRIDGWDPKVSVTYHTDYPDEFKKLVKWFGDWDEAWAVWVMLKVDGPIPENLPWRDVADRNLVRPDHT